MAVKFKPAGSKSKSKTVGGVKFTGNQEMQYAAPAPPLPYAPPSNVYSPPPPRYGMGTHIWQAPPLPSGGYSGPGTFAPVAGPVDPGAPRRPTLPAASYYNNSIAPLAPAAGRQAAAGQTMAGGQVSAPARSHLGYSGPYYSGWGTSPAAYAGWEQTDKGGWRPAYSGVPDQTQSPNGWFMNSDGNYVPNFAPGAWSSGNNNTYRIQKYRGRSGSDPASSPKNDKFQPAGTPGGGTISEYYPGWKPPTAPPGGGGGTIWNPDAWGQSNAYSRQGQSAPRWLQSMVNWRY